MKDKAVILFTRIPLHGKTKTRLQPFLDSKECCALQQAFIQDIYSVLKSTGFDIIVYYTPDGYLDDLRKIITDNISFLPQNGDGLGYKMHNAIKAVLKSGYRACVLIGSDIPLISPEDIDKTFAILRDKDMVISPTEDGGYWLIGMKKPCKEVFSIKYGTETVMEETMKEIKRIRKTCGTGTTLLDIDNQKDLEKLIDLLGEQEPLRCLETRKVLKEIMCRR